MANFRVEAKEILSSESTEAIAMPAAWCDAIRRQMTYISGVFQPYRRMATLVRPLAEWRKGNALRNSHLSHSPTNRRIPKLDTTELNLLECVAQLFVGLFLTGRPALIQLSGLVDH